MIDCGIRTSHKACLSKGLSGEMLIAPHMDPIEPTKLTPRTAPREIHQQPSVRTPARTFDDLHGLADMIRTAAPDLNKDLAASAVKRRPPPVYWKLSFKYDCSAALKPSLVSRFNSMLVATIVPATVA